MLTKRSVLLFAGLLRLVAVILEPDLDLGWRQVEPVRQMLPLLGTQVLLELEALLQLVHLRLREQDASLPL